MLAGATSGELLFVEFGTVEHDKTILTTIEDLARYGERVHGSNPRLALRRIGRSVSKTDHDFSGPKYPRKTSP
jgi:hypothetical protein